MIRKLFNNYTRTLCNLIYTHRSKIGMNYDRAHVAQHIVKGAKLTSEEKALIKERWGGLDLPLKRGYEFFLGMKCLDDFNSDYLPSSYFHPYVEGWLNLEPARNELNNKSILDRLYSGCRFPKTILRSYGGVLWNKDLRPILKEEGAEIIRTFEGDLLFKPSIDSTQGKGIKLFRDNEKDELIQDILSGKITQSGDFVIQEKIIQSSQTAIFNPASLNCFRLTTLNLNGVISCHSRTFKCGAKDSFVDNIGEGRRGVIIGVNPDGTLKDYGFYGNGDKTSVHNDINFSGHRISHFPSLEATVLKLHKYTEDCRVIGWDICLDSNNEPVLIEANTIKPGISVEQMASGPIFGDRTAEVVDYLKEILHKRQPKFVSEYYIKY